MAMLWETATGQRAHSPFIVQRSRALSLPRLQFKFLLPLYPAILFLSFSHTYAHTHTSTLLLFHLVHSLLPRYFIPLRNCIPSVVKPRPAPTESSQDASLSASRFNCLSMPDDAFSARAIPSERPRERHRFFRKRLRPRLIIDSHSLAPGCPEKRNVLVAETPLTSTFSRVHMCLLCGLEKIFFI